MLSKLLPFEKITYRSTLSKDEVLQNLKDAVETKRAQRFGPFRNRYDKHYVGTIVGDTFHIQRAINYRNSMLPQIKGTVSQTMNGTKIEVEMNLVTKVKIFMFVWFTAVSMFVVFNGYQFFTQVSEFSHDALPLLIPFVMLLAGILMVVFGFKYESGKSRNDLARLMKAKITER